MVNPPNGVPSAASAPSGPLHKAVPAIPALHITRGAVLVTRIAIVATIVVGSLYNLVGFPKLKRPIDDYYRIDLDVYRLGGSAFAHGMPLYGQMPPTRVGATLPFTYPPLSAVLFSPMSYTTLEHAGFVLTALSLVFLFVTAVPTVMSLGFTSPTMLFWSSAAVVAVALVLEPVFSTFDYGQINIALMALVAVDVLLPKTWWPRGSLVGLVAAIKLTPIAFVLLFVVRKDFRAAVVAILSALIFTGVGFAATWSDSVEYWTHTLIAPDRIGNPEYPANQSVIGVLARLGIEGTLRSAVWLVVCAGILVVAVIAMRKALAAGQLALALCVNALLGLLASPISWSHHWVWAVPMLTVLVVLGCRQRSVLVMSFALLGAVLLHFAPHWRLSAGQESGVGWSFLDQLGGSSYVWWGLAAIVLVAVRTWPTAKVTESESLQLA